jgi:hypothetical protein
MECREEPHNYKEKTKYQDFIIIHQIRSSDIGAQTSRIL